MNGTIYKKDVPKGGLSRGAMTGVIIGISVAVIVVGLAAMHGPWFKKQGNKRNRRRKTEPRFSVFGVQPNWNFIVLHSQGRREDWRT